MSNASDSAFSSERTIIKPSLGRRPAPQEASALYAGPTETSTGRSRLSLNAIESELQRLPQRPRTFNPNRLIDLARPLLLSGMKIGRLDLKADEMSRLSGLLSQGMARFETQMQSENLSSPLRLAARYVLCTFLDECAGNTPWGGNGSWAPHSLLLLNFKETWGGEKVYRLLQRFELDARQNAAILELLQQVLSLGFKGRYHIEEGGNEKHAQVRHALQGRLHQVKPSPEQLADYWFRPVPEVPKGLKAMPFWLVPAVCAGILAISFSWFSLSLNSQSDAVFQRILALALPPPVLQTAQKEPDLTVGEYLELKLEPEIRMNLVSLGNQSGDWVLTVVGDGMFDSGQTRILNESRPLLDAIGAALADTTGPVLISGHTDSQPIKSIAFPSNWHLSKARAEAVGKLLERHLDPERLMTEGLGDTRPLASNATAAGRAQNRRVEIRISSAAARLIAQPR